MAMKKDATKGKRGNAAVLRNPIISAGTQCNHGPWNSFRVTLTKNGVNNNKYVTVHILEPKNEVFNIRGKRRNTKTRKTTNIRTAPLSRKRKRTGFTDTSRPTQPGDFKHCLGTTEWPRNWS
jgi:hypothetical protein